MNTRKPLLQIIGLILTLGLLAGCGGAPAEPTAMPTATSAPTAEATVAAQVGFITGRVRLAGPPTPPMVVYAVDPTTGLWVSTETEAADGEAPFTLTVQPGSYQVFAFSDNGAYTGYAPDGWTLAEISVAADQTIAEIIVGPPGQSECGSMFGVLASPDGRFAAVPGPSEECKAALTAAPAGGYGPVSLEVCRILQESASQALSVAFELEESAPFTDFVSGETGQGCKLTATGTGQNFSNPNQVVVTLVNAFVGWTEEIAYQASGPTGDMTGMTRDMGLMLISAEWTPAPEVQCPADQPISMCEMQPEQMLYTIQIQAAQK